MYNFILPLTIVFCITDRMHVSIHRTHMRRKRGGGEHGGHSLPRLFPLTFFGAHLVAWQLDPTRFILTSTGRVPDFARIILRTDLYEPHG